MPDRIEALWRQLPGVHTPERSRFQFFAGLATLISLAQTMGLAGSEALFLARFGAAMLPVTFIAAALGTVFGTMIYATRVGVERNDTLFVQMLTIAAVVLGAAAVAVQLGQDWVLPLLVCIFYLTQAVFVNHLWTFTGDYFDTVASKRLIPLFTIGGSVGGVLGGLLAMGVTRVVGPSSLIIGWAALLGASALLVRRAHHNLVVWGTLEADEADETSVEGIRAAMRYLGMSPLGRWLCISAMTMMLSLFVAQYIYLDIFAREFPDSAALAAFFGIYLALTNVIEIFIEVRITPWLIARRGVPAANLLHPLLTILTFGGLASQYGMASGVAARMNRELVENAISSPVRALVYNAMPLRFRGRTRAFLEGIVVYAGMALAGVLLLFFEAPDPLWLCAIGGSMAVVYLAANLRVQREYRHALTDELRAGRLDLDGLGEEVGPAQARALAEAWEQLLESESDEPSSALLRFIPSLAARGLIDPLLRAATHPNAEIRRACIDALGAEDVEDAAAVFLVALDDEDASVRLAALRALLHGRASSRPLEPLMKQLLSDSNPEVRAEAALQAGSAGEPVFAEMIRSPSPETAVAALRSAPISALDVAATRVDDANPLVRAAALECFARAGALPPLEREALYDVAQNPDPRVRRAGLMVLANLDEPEALATLATALADSSVEVRFAAETVLGTLGESGIHAVEPLLRARRERVVLRAMRVIAAVGTPDALALLKGELRHRARDLWWGTIAFTELPPGGGTADTFLRAAFQDNIIRSRRLAFRILELLEGRRMVRWVDKALQRGSNRSKADALEVISLLGDREAARLLVLFHNKAPLEDRLKEVAEVVDLPQGRDEIVAMGCKAESRWIQMAARAIAAPDQIAEGEEELMKQLLTLKKVPLLSQLSFEQLDAVRRTTREVEYLANETIVKQDDRGDDLFFLIEGSVRMVQRQESSKQKILGRQEAVSYFGEMAALSGERRTATVIAEETSRVLCLDGESLKDLIRQMPEISFQIMHVLIDRVRVAEAASRRR